MVGRRALRLERRRSRRSVRSGNRQDAVGAEAPGDDGLRGGTANRGVRTGARARERASSPSATSYLYALNPKTGEADRGVRQRRRGRSHAGLGPLSTRLPLELGAARRPRRDRRWARRWSTRTRPTKMEGVPATCALTTCAPGSCAGRSTSFRATGEPGDRDLGGRFVALHRRRQRLGADERGRRARVRLPADDERDQRHVRRPSARRQPVQHVDRVPRRGDRQARLALPDGAPRSVRLRQPGGADPRRHHRRRHAGSRRSCRSPSSRSPTCSIA